EVGRLILQASAASNLKEVSLELGGKCPMIICDDADLDTAVDLAFTGSFINKGEMCIASSRVFVHESIHDQIVEKLVEKTKSWVVGDPFNPKVQQGPQVDKKQFEKIMSYIDHGKRQGATLVTGGKRCGDNKGHYVEPTIFTDVKDDMLIARDEIFGPVVAVMKFETIEEVIERANDTNYGLAAMLVTNNLNVANTVSRSLHAGMVWINCYLAIGPDAPFGGFKMSGLGKDLGMDGLYKYTQLKTVVTPIYNSPWL
ncbi:aldehyde dehydrogenase family protein, partial [Paucibacter sp. DJ4R-1]|nr:aldehyde dehydrogenase family protein [Paucibacter sp. DJ4R-1]